MPWTQTPLDYHSTHSCPRFLIFPWFLIPQSSMLGSGNDGMLMHAGRNAASPTYIKSTIVCFFLFVCFLQVYPKEAHHIFCHIIFIIFLTYFNYEFIFFFIYTSSFF